MTYSNIYLSYAINTLAMTIERTMSLVHLSQTCLTVTRVICGVVCNDFGAKALTKICQIFMF